MRPSELLRRPVILIALGLLATAGLVLGARAVTASLLDPAPASASPSDVDATTTTANTEQTTSTTRTASTIPSTTVGTPDSSLPSTGDPVLLEGLAAEGVVVEEPVVTPHETSTFRDLVTVLPAVATGLPSLPVEAAPPTDDASEPTGGPQERPDVNRDEAAPLPRAFAVGVMVETEGQYAVIRVGVDAGPEGLADLVVDLGDGKVLDVPQGRIDQIGDIGTIEIVHRYEPTLTPQPQEVTATAIDGAGTVKVASASFETSARFMVTYSPLTVTALDDCDLFGKGDFELEWNNDGRDRRSRFDLGKGESYVEEEFRVGVETHYEEVVDFSISIVELDSVALTILRFVSGAYLDSGFIGPSAQPWLQVMQLGTYKVPISIEPENYEECDTRLEFTVTLALSERTTG